MTQQANMRRVAMAGSLVLITVIAVPLIGVYPWSSPANGGEPPRSLTGPVVKVIDGDTIDVELDGQRVRVRYIGVNTPETKHPTKGAEPCGKDDKEANRTFVEGKTVCLELDLQHWGRYQRLLAYVYVGDIMVNAELVRQGYAQAATYVPNVKYQDVFLKLQREAREAGVGCWKAP